MFLSLKFLFFFIIGLILNYKIIIIFKIFSQIFFQKLYSGFTDHFEPSFKKIDWICDF